MLETIYLIHHSHTDIGYTHDQQILWELQRRFIDEAIDAAARDADAGVDGDHAFRWTVETTRPLLHWLERAPAARIERFLELERAGRIEVTAMPLNITPLSDTGEIIESLRPVARLRREYGITIRHAMNCDVNGQNWPLVDVLLDAGVEAFSMATNTHFGGYPLERPGIFAWEGPSGRTVPVFNGFPYESGYRFGIGRERSDFETYYLPALERRLEETGYDFPILLLQSFHPFGDNGSAYTGFGPFIERWNAEGRRPRIVFATPAMFWKRFFELDRALPHYRGDWTDYWNFGCISSAREMSMNRRSRSTLRAADAAAVAAAGAASGQPTRATHRPPNADRTAAWNALTLWDEHTWGAECSVVSPWAEDTLAQWHHKASYAYTARSASRMLLRDALAALSRQVERTQSDDILLFNPLPFPRTLSGPVAEGVVAPRGLREDATAARHWQDRRRTPDPIAAVHGEDHRLRASGASEEPQWHLPPTELPGFGYAVVPRSTLKKVDDGNTRAAPASSAGAGAVLENRRFRIELDTEHGGVRSWYDRELDHEWVDRSHELRFFSFVRESLDRSKIDERYRHAPAAARKEIFEIDFSAPELERSATWKGNWPRRYDTAAGGSIETSICELPDGFRAIQRLVREDRRTDSGAAAPTREGERSGEGSPDSSGAGGSAPRRDIITLSLFLPTDGEAVRFDAWWHMDDEPWPEATYLAFPFNLRNVQARYDAGGRAVRTDSDQIPGCCRDYFTTQGWADLSESARGVTIATPENPMVQFGGFTFGGRRREIEPHDGLFLGWVTANYWDTNFRASQPGLVHASYSVRPHDGFTEEAAHRFGLSAAYSEPIAQQCGEEMAHRGAGGGGGGAGGGSDSGGSAGGGADAHDRGADLLPGSGSLLRLPGSDGEDTPIVVLSLKSEDDPEPEDTPHDGPRRADSTEASALPTDGSSVIVRLLNAGDRPATARLRSGLLTISEAYEVGLLDDRLRHEDPAAGSDADGLDGADSTRPIPVAGGALSADIGARRTVTIRLVLDR